MRRRTFSTLVLALGLTGATATAAEANNASLRGSRAAMELQNRVAKTHNLPFYGSAAAIRAGVERGELVELTGDANYDVADFVSHPFAHPAVKLFVERVAAQYHEACGQKLVVTSAVRPENRQPSNAHKLSVHPAGMAVDLRYSANRECRGWLAGELLRLEGLGVIDATLEMRPPHFHVAVFPGRYAAYEYGLAADSVAAESLRLLEEAVAAREAGEDAYGEASAAEQVRAGVLRRVAVLIARIVLPV